MKAPLPPPCVGKRKENFGIARVQQSHSLQTSFEVLGGKVLALLVQGPDEAQGSLSIFRILADNLVSNGSVLACEATARPIADKDRLIEEKQTVVPMNSQKIVSDSESRVKCSQAGRQNLLFVIQIRYVRHHEMERNRVSARSLSFRSNIVDRLG